MAALTKRTPKANMILFSLWAVGLIAVVLLVCLGFYLIFFQQNRGQTQCDEIALNIADGLNSDDRIGQMNTIVEHSRQLVYLSRQALEVAGSSRDTHAYVALADLLLADAKDGATLVNKERLNQIDIAVSNCRNYAEDVAKSSTTNGAWLFCWFIEDQLSINQIQFGSVKDILSNAQSPTAVAGLHKFDLDNHYVEPKTNFYYGNISAPLPAPDEKLPFYLSALAPLVENTVSPARFFSPGAFDPSTVIYDKTERVLSKPLQLPGAILVMGRKRIKTDKIEGKIDIGITSAASAPGASTAP